MNKGDSNARRLGSQPDEESRYQGGMRSVPTEAGKTESSASEREGEGEGFLFHYASTIAVLGATLVGTVVICLIISRMWDEDKIRIQVLGFLINFCRLVARKAGSMALEYEKSYYEYVDTLH